MRYIGDVHGDLRGNMERYLEITNGCWESIQVGDFGAGFADLPTTNLNHRFIRGNHDNPEICKTSLNYIPDNTYRTPEGTYFLGGAHSIDQKFRLIGRDWWPDEELNNGELYTAIAFYEKVKPSIVVTHDAPYSVSMELFANGKNKHSSRTSNALQCMLEIYRPNVWIFGHWHHSARKVIQGCEFICLNELEYIDL